ncbi:MAG: arabinogalactan endo-1,4-beta-galactosidase, partial [Oscillospiraceae bacterium]|nr:arabinogalactan endo-1,4-beta-galactosidase [Oscillospiraceae bacterium]
MKRNIAKKALCLALLTVVLFTFAMSPAYALQGEAEFKPAESDIAGKYWVSSSVEDGVLLVDLGGAYDAVYKTEIIFEDAAKANAYLLQGSTDGEAWTALAARESGDAPAGGYTDVFSLAGLRYIRVTAYQGAIVKDLHIYNYLREDMNNGSDTSGVSLTNSYTYNEDGSPQDGVRGGVATPDTMETGENFFGLTKDMGWDTIRLRIWNEPRSEGGWQPEDVAEDGPLQAFPEGDPNGSCSPTQTLEYAKYVI